MFEYYNRSQRNVSKYIRFTSSTASGPPSPRGRQKYAACSKREQTAQIDKMLKTDIEDRSLGSEGYYRILLRRRTGRNYSRYEG